MDKPKYSSILAFLYLQDKTLHAGSMTYPLRKDQYFKYLADQSHRTTQPHFQSFGSYMQINSKSANLTVRDVFMKQLLAIRQLTPDKASLIVARFPTALALWRHYQALPDDRSRAMYFKDWMVSDSQRRFGLALSTRLHRLVCGSYDDDSL